MSNHEIEIEINIVDNRRMPIIITIIITEIVYLCSIRLLLLLFFLHL